MGRLLNLTEAFFEGWNGQACRHDCAHADKEMREHLSEKQIDKMLQDSFPASDPPSTY